MKRKSQAALEFLMTYGWAILVVLVVIGALAYFGILNPEGLLPSRCTLQTGLRCVDHTITPTVVTAVVQNSLGYDISAVTVYAGQCGSSGPVTIANDNQVKFAIACTAPGPLTTGARYSNTINVSYTASSDVGGLLHKNVGTVRGKVE